MNCSRVQPGGVCLGGEYSAVAKDIQVLLDVCLCQERYWWTKRDYGRQQVGCIVHPADFGAMQLKLGLECDDIYSVSDYSE